MNREASHYESAVGEAVGEAVEDAVGGVVYLRLEFVGDLRSGA